MNTAVISLGSNAPDKSKIMEHAIGELGIDVVEATPPYIDPDDNHPSMPYLNIVARIETTMAHDELNRHFKLIEQRFGRQHSMSMVTLDIDIVVFNDSILRPLDYERTYFVHGYRLLSSRVTPESSM